MRSSVGADNGRCDSVRPPIRSGDCGVAAPVLVSSIGGMEKVLFDPPLVLDCAMVVGLDRWLRESVQPAAKRGVLIAGVEDHRFVIRMPQRL